MPAVADEFDASEADQIPEYAPPSSSTGWYLRGDITYAVGNPVYDFTLLGEEAENIRFGGGLGVGYRFNEWLRGDLTFNYVAGDRFDLDNGTLSISSSHDMWSGLLSGYVDLGTFAGFTPYVGAGVGLLGTADKIAASIPGFAADLDQNQTEFAYSLNAGVGYRVSDKLTLDFGYQFFASPSTEFLDVEALSVDDGVKQHQIKIGLRYDLY